MLGVGKEKQNCGLGGECFSCILALFFSLPCMVYSPFPMHQGTSVVLWNSLWFRRRQIPPALPGIRQHRATSAPGLHHGLPPWNLQVLPRARWRWSSWLFPGGIVSSSSSSPWRKAPLWSHTVTVTPTDYCDRSFLNTLGRARFYYSEKGSEKWLGTLPSLNSPFSRQLEPVYRHLFF